MNKKSLSEKLKEILSQYSDFERVSINEHEWVITKFSNQAKTTSFRLYEASKEEFENLRKKYSLTIQEDYDNNDKTFRMVRGNNAQECLISYFQLINYNPLSITKKEFDSIELVEKDTSWSKNLQENTYTAIKDNASIFITYDHGIYEMLNFKKEGNFKIDNDFIIFDKTTVTKINI